MPAHLLRRTPDYTLGIWKMEETESDLLRLAGNCERPNHKSEVRRMEYLAVRALATEMGVEPENIAYLPSGKPFLKDRTQSISISHTRQYVGVALSGHEGLGLDVEHAGERVRRIRRRFMHPDEERRLMEVCSPLDETVGLLLHWCAKESLFKAVPEEGVDFAQELRIGNFEKPSLEGRFSGRFLRTGQTFRIDYLVEADFVLTCSFSARSK